MAKSLTPTDLNLDVNEPHSPKKGKLCSSSSDGVRASDLLVDSKSTAPMADQRMAPGENNDHHHPTETPPTARFKKRKLDWSEEHTPPTAPATQTDVSEFNIFTAILQNMELMFEVAKQLETDDLVALYAISKDFHLRANKRITSLILAIATFKASESSRTFIFKCYKSLCQRDPNRTTESDESSKIRWVPSFRWLRMILFREEVVDQILFCLYEQGHRLPRRASLSVKRLWLTLDISDNRRRIGLIQNEDFWTANDIFIITIFFLKLDMRLTDPLMGDGQIGLRRMLLNQRSLSTLARVLRREEMKDQLDLLRMIVQYDYSPPIPPRHSILGIPPGLVGRLRLEGWGCRNIRFIPIDELIQREAMRREMALHDYHMDMMIYGYINKKTFETITNPPPYTFAGQPDPDDETWWSFEMLELEGLEESEDGLDISDGSARGGRSDDEVSDGGEAIDLDEMEDDEDSGMEGGGMEHDGS